VAHVAWEIERPEAIARFQREATAVAKMGKHPHIVTVHDLGQEGRRSQGRLHHAQRPRSTWARRAASTASRTGGFSTRATRRMAGSSQLHTAVA
jgi:hypothetical protein